MKYLFLLLLPMMATAQQEMPLYGTGAIPNSRPVANAETVDTVKQPDGTVWHLYNKVSHPTLTVWQPPAARRTGTAVIVCPGGGYGQLAMTHEGTAVAAWLNSLGITAFVLKYRLPSDETMIDKTIGPLQDAQRAIQLVRQRAGEWGVNPGKIGILGFSAGGHLASTAETHFMKAVIPNPAGVSLRPDFAVLLYPVISFDDSIGHRGSRDNLIGKNPPVALIREYSNELQVTDQTPPTFLIHAEDDEAVMVVNSIEFYEALMRHHVPAEMHLYPRGGHGYGMFNPTTKDQWPDRLRNWLAAGGWL